jgi:hypothetical protein
MNPISRSMDTIDSSTIDTKSFSFSSETSMTSTTIKPIVWPRVGPPF